MGNFRNHCGAQLINKIIWTVVVLIWAPCLFSLFGGAFVYRENLPSGLYNRYTLTLYKTLPVPPKGPAYCDFLNVEVYALAFSCSGKPPFIGWLQGGKY
jgi:hypothetical protein